ncbi:MAG TPA: MFS transporter [Dermatophilaceae bacterium]|nr:MFS transporter [Dermatophilaceae bacterium]
MTRQSGLLPAWIVVAAGVAAAFHIGKLAPAIPALQEQLGVTLVQAGWLVSLVQLAGMLLGIVIGTAADGIGLRRTMLTGLTLVTVAGIAGGFAHSVGALLALRAAEGVGVLLTTVPAPGLIRRLLQDDHVTRMLGVWGAYVPFGTGLALILGPLLIHGPGWPWWWWAVAAGTALMGTLVALLVPPDPLRGGSAPAGEGLVGRARRTLTHRGPWLAAAVFGLYASQWMAVIGFLPTLYAAAGWVGATGALLSGIVPFCNVIGNLAAGWGLHRGRSPATLLVTGLGGQAVGSFLAFTSLTEGAPVIRYAGALLFSTVGGLVPGALFALAPKIAPSATTVSTSVGWIQQLSSAGQVLGPPFAAAVVGIVGGWQWTWLITLATSGLGALAALALQRDLRRRHPAERGTAG